MRIAVVADIKNPYPAKGYGGYQRFYDGLSVGMKKLGASLVMFGQDVEPTSFIPEVVPVPVNGDRELYKRKLKNLIDDSFDAVIFQNPNLPVKQIMDRLPYVCRVGGYQYGEVLRPGVRYITLSNWGCEWYGRDWPVIHQLCSPEEVEFCREKEDWALYVSNLERGFREKGLSRACRLAKEAGIALKVAGPVGPNQAALERMKKLEGSGVEYIGPIQGEKKKNLLKKAKAVFYPIDKKCKEIGGTILIEAAFCGTPVIATKVGSIPEYVEHGKTGYLCEEDEEFLSCLEETDGISPVDCYYRAQEIFSPHRVAKQYLEVLKENER